MLEVRFKGSKKVDRVNTVPPNIGDSTLASNKLPTLAQVQIQHHSVQSASLKLVVT